MADERPTFGSAFTGIGGIDHGFELAGWECAWQIEIDPFCNAVLETRYPTVKRYRDIRETNGRDLESVRALVGGSPCQGLSVAGLRRGLADERSALFWEFIRLAHELEPPPQWLLFENVPGLLTSNRGRDFGLVLEAMVELGYGVAWRVLDAQFFGVPQRRARVFLVGHLGGPCPREILFESESGDRPSEALSQEREDIAYALTSRAQRISGEDNYIAATLTESYGHHGWADLRGDGRELLIPEIHAAIRSNPRNNSDPTTEARSLIIAPTLRSSYERPGGGPAILSGGSPSDTVGVRETDGIPRRLDSPRYRALGNAVVPQVAEWIGRRILEAMRIR